MQKLLTLTALVAITGALATHVYGQDAAFKPAAAATSAAAASPAPAMDLVTTARKDSTKMHRATMVIFHASWCGWCKKLDAMMARPEFKKMFDSNFSVVTLDVMEHGDKVAQLENPGGNDYMKTLGGEKSGLPFYAWLDENGKKIADSNAMPRGENIGYPGEPAEITAFVGLIKKTAPNLSDSDLNTLRDYLVANAPKAAAPAH